MSALDVDNDALRLLFRIRDELQLAADNLNAIHQSASTLQQKSNRVSSGLANRKVQ